MGGVLGFSGESDHVRGFGVEGLETCGVAAVRVWTWVKAIPQTNQTQSQRFHHRCVFATVHKLFQCHEFTVQRNRDTRSSTPKKGLLLDWRQLNLTNVGWKPTVRFRQTCQDLTQSQQGNFMLAVGSPSSSVKVGLGFQQTEGRNRNPPSSGRFLQARAPILAPTFMLVKWMPRLADGPSRMPLT